MPDGIPLLMHSRVKAVLCRWDSSMGNHSEYQDAVLLDASCRVVSMKALRNDPPGPMTYGCLAAREKVTVQQHHIFGRSARLTDTGYAAPDRLPKSAAPLNGYRLKEMPGFRPPGERLREKDVRTV